MKLNYAQLEIHLTKKLFPVYIISGDEILLKQDAAKLLRKAAKKAGFIEHVRLTSEAGFDWEQLFQLLYSTSLLSEKRLIECDFRESTPNKTASNILKEYAEKLSTDNILLIDLAKIDTKIAKSAWYQSLEKVGIAIACWPIPREQLPQWVINRAKKYKLQFTLEAANLLTDYMEGNLVAVAQTIEKVYLLTSSDCDGQIKIDNEIIQKILTEESHFTIFDFIENLIAGDKVRTLHILECLNREGIEPAIILWGITRELRLLADVATQLKAGQTHESLMQKYRIFPRRQSSIRQFLSKFSVENCWQFIHHAAEIDKIIKGLSPGNVWHALQLYCLRLCN